MTAADEHVFAARTRAEDSGPSTTNPRHIVDNLGAGRGELPDADIRRRIERIFDELS